MVKFVKDSFQNGNRYTNIVITVILLLVGIIGYFLRGIYQDFKDVQVMIHRHETQIQVLEATVQKKINKIQE